MRMNMEYYYHVTHPLLHIGSIIDNGNFGRLLEKYDEHFGDPKILYREEVLELVRKEKYPNKPSRLYSIFLCSSHSVALDYCNIYMQNSNIYKVEIIDCTKQTHSGFWCPPFPKGYLRSYAYSFAENYWKGIIDKICIESYMGKKYITPEEIIVESPVRIIERL
jgi:hypothetical protein